MQSTTVTSNMRPSRGPAPFVHLMLPGIVALSMTLAELMISRTSHALRVTIMLSPHDQRMANQLLSRLSAYVQQREAFDIQQTLGTSSGRALCRHSSCNGT